MLIFREEAKKKLAFFTIQKFNEYRKYLNTRKKTTHIRVKHMQVGMCFQQIGVQTGIDITSITVLVLLFSLLVADLKCGGFGIKHLLIQCM